MPLFTQLNILNKIYMCENSSDIRSRLCVLLQYCTDSVALKLESD